MKGCVRVERRWLEVVDGDGGDDLNLLEFRV